MDQGSDRGLHLPPFQGVRDLAEAGYDLTRLGGHREGLGHETYQQGFGVGGKRWRHPHLALEPLAKLVSPDGFRNRMMRG